MDLALSATRAQASHRADCPEIGPICAVRAEPPQEHHTTIYLGELRLIAEYGLWSGVALQGSLPFRLIRTDTEFTDLNGNPITLDYQSIHHRNETLAGPGDAQLLLHVGRRLFDVNFGARAGVSFPTGKVNEDPYRLGTEGKPHEHIQFGTGTFDPILGLDVSHAFGKFVLGGFGQAQLPLYEGPQGYRAGDRYVFGVVGAHPLGTQDFNFRISVIGLDETAEHWHGVVPTEEGNQGRTDLYAGPGITILLGHDYTLSFDARARLYGHAPNAQLEMPLLLEADIGTLFHLESGMHVDEGETGRGDVVDLVVAGEYKPLRGVVGKWTIFDFWAPWCEACRSLDGELRRLAGERSDVAVRRVNIVDFDSPIAEHELPGVSALPHVRLLDPSGKSVYSASGTPEELMSQVERRLR